jgi:hypothetical protein
MKTAAHVAAVFVLRAARFSHGEKLSAERTMRGFTSAAEGVTPHPGSGLCPESALSRKERVLRLVT